MHVPRLLWITEEPQLPEGEHQRLRNIFEIIQVARLAEAVCETRSEEIDCVLVSGKLSDCTGNEVLETLTTIQPHVPVVFWNPSMTAGEAVQLVRNGAHHCFGFRDSLDELRQALERASHERRIRRKLPDRASQSLPGLVGESPAMQEIVNTIQLIGSRRCTVLVSGETGTGKELAARALHQSSPRAKLSMVAVNCSALPENLLEAELFGHVKGAFTGASGNRVGRFEQAHKSTLFLDEIGEMPLDLQAKLLRVLQERELQRLGSSETIQVDVRVIAASNVNLAEKVRERKFREDLYYRLNVVPLRMPPLRERKTDIPRLVHHFIDKVCEAEGIPVKRVTDEALQRLTELPWPGNVRQLENTVEMAIAMCGDRDVLHSVDFGLKSRSLDVLPPKIESDSYQSCDCVSFDSAVYEFKRTLLQGALAKTGGNKTAAAELLGLKRTTLIMKLRGLEYPGISLQEAS